MFMGKSFIGYNPHECHGECHAATVNREPNDKPDPSYANLSAK